MMTDAVPQPMIADEESATIVRLAQRYAVGNLPEGIALSEATLPQLLAAIKKGMKSR